MKNLVSISHRQRPDYRFSNTLFILICIMLSLIAYACQGGEGEENNARTTGTFEKDSITAESLADSAIAQLYVQWDWKKAEQSFVQALELNPRLGRALANYAWYHTLFLRNDEAIALVQRAVAAEPDNPRWPVWLAWLHLGFDDIETASAQINECLSSDPDHAEALHVLAKIECATGDFDSAIAAHEKAASVDPRWRASLGQTYALAGKRTETLEIIDSVTSEDDVWSSYGIAKIYAVLEMPEEALQWLEQAYARRHPYFPWGKMDPDLRSLAGIDRFEELYARLNL